MATNRVFVAITVAFILFLVIASIVSIFKGGVLIIPGLAPQVWKKNEPVDLYVNKVTSIKSPIPYRYNDLPVCKSESPEQKSENLGEVITGNRIEKSVFEIKMNMPKSCTVACREINLSKEDKQTLIGLIDDEYLVQWQVDTLPAAHKQGKAVSSGEDVYEIGFPLGFYNVPKEGAPKNYYLYNHVEITISYNKAKEDGYHIVFF
jgi:transmembrane 9 superfamily protein 2/4